MPMPPSPLEEGEGWGRLTETIGHRVQIVGDDLLVTNPNKLREAIRLVGHP